MSRYVFAHDESGWSCDKDGRGVSEARTKIGAWFSVWAETGGLDNLTFVLALLTIAAWVAFFVLRMMGL